MARHELQGAQQRLGQSCHLRLSQTGSTLGLDAGKRNGLNEQKSLIDRTGKGQVGVEHGREWLIDEVVAQGRKSGWKLLAQKLVGLVQRSIGIILLQRHERRESGTNDVDLGALIGVETGNLSDLLQRGFRDCETTAHQRAAQVDHANADPRLHDRVGQLPKRATRAK